MFACIRVISSRGAHEQSRAHHRRQADRPRRRRGARETRGGRRAGFARSRTEAEEAAARVRAAGRRALVQQADLTSPEACRALVSGVAEALGGVDILINMASVYAKRPFGDVSVQDWQAPLAVDLGAAFFCSQAAAPLMRLRGGGRIINFSDWTVPSGRPRYRGFVPYYVAKAGVKALTEALALELAADDILVNAIAPGPILAPPDISVRGSPRRRGGHAARPLGRRDRDRQGDSRAHRQRLHHRRNDPSGRRTAPQMTSISAAGNSSVQIRR